MPVDDGGGRTRLGATMTGGYADALAGLVGPELQIGKDGPQDQTIPKERVEKQGVLPQLTEATGNRRMLQRYETPCGEALGIPVLAGIITGNWDGNACKPILKRPCTRECEGVYGCAGYRPVEVTVEQTGLH